MSRILSATFRYPEKNAHSRSDYLNIHKHTFNEWTKSKNTEFVFFCTEDMSFMLRVDDPAIHLVIDFALMITLSFTFISINKEVRVIVYLDLDCKLVENLER